MAKEHTFDHEIAITPYTAAYIERLMLMKDDQGRQLCTVTEDVQPHASQLKFIQKDWTGGHGQFEQRDGSVYYEGQSIDTTIPGVAFLGPAYIGSAMYNLVNAAVSYNATGTAYATDTTDARDPGIDDMELMDATPEVNDAYYFGRDTTFGLVIINVSTAGAGTWTITWEYYNGSSWAALSGVTDGTTGFTVSGLKQVTFTVPGDWATVAVNSITKYWVRARISAFTSSTVSALGAQAWLATGAALGDTAGIGFGSAPPVAICWWTETSSIFLATATSVYEWKIGVIAGWYERWNFAGLTITDIKPYANATDSYLLVALGASDEYYYSTDGATFTQVDAHANNFVTKFLSAPNALGTSNVLWMGHNSNVNSNNGALGFGGVTPIQIGDATTSVTNLFLHNDNILIGKQDGLYQLDADSAVHLIMNLKGDVSSKNFKYVANYKGASICSLSNNVIEISVSNAVDDIGPSDVTDYIGKTGECVGIDSNQDWVYVAMDEGTNTHIYKGKQREDGRWAWCPWIFLSTATCAVIRVLPIAADLRYLMYGYTNVAYNVSLFDNPLNPFGGYTKRFANTEQTTPDTAGWLRLRYTYGANPLWDKLWDSVVTDISNSVAAHQTITVSYLKDTDSSATAFTSAISTDGVAKTAATAVISCKKIQFHIALSSDDQTKTPILRYFEARGVEQPEVVRTYECVYYVGDMPSKRASTIRTFLRNCRASTSLIKLADQRWGESTADTTYHWVCLQPGYPTEVSVLQEKGHIEMGLKCRWQEVSYTVS